MIQGSLRFGENASLRMGHRYGFNIIDRQYDIQVYRGIGPLPNVELELRRGDETLWTGDSDADGRSSFNLTFVDIFHLVRPYVPGGPSVVDLKNMTETLALIAIDGRDPVEEEIGLFTDTPIVFKFAAKGYTPLLWIPIAAGLVGILLILYYVRRVLR